MSIDPILEDIRCPHCLTGIIGKTIAQELKNPDNYLEGVVVIITYICLRYQTTVHRDIREITI